MLGCIILCIGGALQATASTIPHMIVGRIVAGIGNGFNTGTIRKCHSPCQAGLVLLTARSCVAFRAYVGDQPRKRSKSLHIHDRLCILPTHHPALALHRVSRQHLWRYDSLLGRLRHVVCA